jgi:hypothetical protein
MPRGKKSTDAQTATISVIAEDTSRRPLAWYDDRLSDAEDIALGRGTRYQRIRAEFDELLARFEDRAKVFQVMDRMLPAYGRMTEATDAEAKARELRDKRAAEIDAEAKAMLAEIADGDGPDQTATVVGQQTVNGVPAPEPAPVG